MKSDKQLPVVSHGPPSLLCDKTYGNVSISLVMLCYVKFDQIRSD